MIVFACSENDNKPEFGRLSMEIELNETVPDGYKIPLQGAMDVDEGVNGHIEYVLNCLQDEEEAMSNGTVSRDVCYPLFDLMVLSPSESSTNFDQLALKYSPSLSTVRLRDRYELSIDALNPHQRDKQRVWRSSLFIHIHIRRQINDLRFTQDEYRFVHISSHNRLVGHVVARSSMNTKTDDIRYRLINVNDDQLVLNERTGELSWREEPTTINVLDVLIEAFDSSQEEEKRRRRHNVTRVKIFFRPLEQLRNVSMRFSSLSNSEQVEPIDRSSSSSSFFVNRSLPMNVDLIELVVHSSFFPMDSYLLLLVNHRSTFSLLSPSLNIYRLKLHRPLRSSTITRLTLTLQHQLSQQFLTNVTIELIARDLISSSPSISATTTTTSMEVNCRENSSWILHRRDGQMIDRLIVVESLETNFSPSTLFVSPSNSINELELMADECRMRLVSSTSVSQLHLNESHEYRLCSTSISLNLCFNVTWIDERSSPMDDNDRRSSSLVDHSNRSFQPIEVAMFSFSMLFILATFTLLVIICRLQAFHLCLQLKNYLFYGKKYGLSHAQRLSTSSKITVSLSSLPLLLHLSSLLFSLATGSFDRRTRISVVLQRHRRPTSSFSFAIVHRSASHRQRTHRIIIVVIIVVLRARQQSTFRSSLFHTTHHPRLRCLTVVCC